MSAEPTDLPRRLATGAGSAVPLYFESAAHRLFAWLHQPVVRSAPGFGLVICKPFGFEALCAHRAMRAFAKAAVELGVPTLRFDYRGSGDSADIDPTADQIDVWGQDVAAAVSELRRLTGVERVCLLGFRLGALLATLAAARSEAVDAVIVVAPVLSGRRYLRELRTTQLAAAEPGTVIRSDLEAPGVASMEVSGFSLSAATIAHLSQLDLSVLAEPPAPDMLIIDRDDLPGARGWSELLPGLGVRTRYVALPGFVEMITTAPHLAVIPHSMLGAMRDWLRSLQEAVSAPADGGDESHLGLGEPWLTAPVLPLAGNPSDAAPSERPVLLGAERTLFGIVTEPAPDEVRRRAAILLNAGATYHIGSGRVYVSLARRWARRGYVVLRMDLAGLGDSATRPGQPDNEVFPPAALEDVRTAIDFVRDHYDVRDVALGGLCSAAYHALRAAVAGLPVDRLLMVNPQNFVWNEGRMLSDLEPVEVVRNLEWYREHVLSAAAWKQLLTGRVNVWRMVRGYFHRVHIGLESTVRDAARQLRIRLPHDLGSELEEIAARGVRVVFVFARGDPGVELLRIQGGSAVKRLGDRCHVHIVDSADHTFTQSRARAVLEQTLSDELFVRHEKPTDAEGARPVEG